MHFSSAQWRICLSLALCTYQSRTTFRIQRHFGSWQQENGDVESREHLHRQREASLSRWAVPWNPEHVEGKKSKQQMRDTKLRNVLRKSMSEPSVFGPRAAKAEHENVVQQKDQRRRQEATPTCHIVGQGRHEIVLLPNLVFHNVLYWANHVQSSIVVKVPSTVSLSLVPDLSVDKILPLVMSAVCRDWFLLHQVSILQITTALKRAYRPFL